MLDNYDLFLSHERQQETELKRLPLCCCCDERIQSEDLYDIDGSLYCEDCMKNFKHSTENYIREE